MYDSTLQRNSDRRPAVLSRWLRKATALFPILAFTLFGCDLLEPIDCLSVKENPIYPCCQNDHPDTWASYGCGSDDGYPIPCCPRAELTFAGNNSNWICIGQNEMTACPGNHCQHAVENHPFWVNFEVVNEGGEDAPSFQILVRITVNPFGFSPQIHEFWHHAAPLTAETTRAETVDIALGLPYGQHLVEVFLDVDKTNFTEGEQPLVGVHSEVDECEDEYVHTFPLNCGGNMLSKYFWVASNCDDIGDGGGADEGAEQVLQPTKLASAEVETEARIVTPLGTGRLTDAGTTRFGVMNAGRTILRPASNGETAEVDSLSLAFEDLKADMTLAFASHGTRTIPLTVRATNVRLYSDRPLIGRGTPRRWDFPSSHLWLEADVTVDADRLGRHEFHVHEWIPTDLYTRIADNGRSIELRFADVIDRRFAFAANDSTVSLAIRLDPRSIVLATDDVIGRLRPRR